jgi:hypothetical protein
MNLGAPVGPRPVGLLAAFNSRITGKPEVTLPRRISVKVPVCWQTARNGESF